MGSFMHRMVLFKQKFNLVSFSTFPKKTLDVILLLAFNDNLALKSVLQVL